VRALITKARSWLVRLTECNHFQTALWRQSPHAICFIYILDKTKSLLYAKWSLSTKRHHVSTKTVWNKCYREQVIQATWSDQDRIKGGATEVIAPGPPLQGGPPW